MVWESRRGGRTAPSTALHGSLRKGDLLARSSRGVHSADATKPSESGPREVPVGASESSAQPGRRALERGWPQANAETRRTIPRHIRGARERGWGCARWDVRAQRDGSLGPPSATNHVTAAAPRRRGNEPEYRHGRHGRHGRQEILGGVGVCGGRRSLAGGDGRRVIGRAQRRRVPVHPARAATAPSSRRGSRPESRSRNVVGERRVASPSARLSLTEIVVEQTVARPRFPMGPGGYRPSGAARVGGRS
jgi:hypothetical protein